MTIYNQTMPNALVCALLVAVKSDQWPEAKRIMEQLEPHLELAGEDRVKYARELYGDCEVNDNEIQIDDDARWSDCGDGSGWIQAWVHVPAEETSTL